MAITASAVKELRERTGAGMMDCKKALTEANGDVEAAVDWLRKKGLAAAAKKSGRAAAEGLVAVYTDGNKGVVVEVNAETDFVSRNEQFQQFADTAAKVALDNASLEGLSAAGFPGSSRTVSEELTHLISVIGENMNLRRVSGLEVSQGTVSSYVHSATTPTLGRIGVLIGLESSAPAETLNALGRQLAMHVAAANPRFFVKEDVSQADIDRERDVIKAQVTAKVEAEGKPAEIAEKMVEGRMRKFIEENVLNEQVFMIDDTKRKVHQVVADAAKEAGTDIKLAGYVQFRLGEGVEKKEEDFAAEVAAQLGS